MGGGSNFGNGVLGNHAFNVLGEFSMYVSNMNKYFHLLTILAYFFLREFYIMYII